MHALLEAPQFPLQPEEITGPLLDVSDTIDFQLNDYVTQVANDDLPTGHEQRRLIRGTKQRDVAAANTIITRHEGLIAAVAYGFKGRGIDSEDLLIMGRREFLRTALDHVICGPEDFNNSAIVAMESGFASALGEETPADGSSGYSESPMDRVLHFVESVRHVDITQPVASEDAPITPLVERLVTQLTLVKRAKAAHEIAQLKPAERAVLPFLHLPTKEIATSQNLEPNPLGKVIESLRQELRAPSRIGLALVALEGGVQFDLQPPVSHDAMTIRQRQVAFRYLKSRPEIAAELGLSQSEMDHAITDVYGITKARTRTELVLMAHQYNFEPTLAELTAVPEVLRGFTTRQQKVLPRLHLPYETIAEQVGGSKDSINGMTVTCRKHMGMDNNIAMALELRQRGLKYDILVPRVTISTLLVAGDMKVLESLVHFTDKAIAEATNMPAKRVGNIITHSLHRTGARTRIELALMMAEFDTGERRQPDTRTRKQVLAEKLGLDSLDGCDIESYIKRLGSIQQRQSLAYYLADESGDTKPPSWKDLSTEHKIRSASSTAGVGIQNIRKMFEKESRPRAAKDAPTL